MSAVARWGSGIAVAVTPSAFFTRDRLGATAAGTNPAPAAHAHCDGPCGVYDPASIRIAAEAAVSMTKKILALEVPDAGDAKAMAAANKSQDS